GGASVFQLREKDLPDRELLERARNLRRWTREVGALFIVNDRPDVAKLSEADGVHLGPADHCVRDARRLRGPRQRLRVSHRGVAPGRPRRLIPPVRSVTPAPDARPSALLPPGAQHPPPGCRTNSVRWRVWSIPEVLVKWAR